MTDGYKVYTEAFLKRLGQWDRKPYRGHGRPPYGSAGTDCLNYSQVVKTRQGKKLEKVEYKVMFGTIPEGWFNTSVVGRMNLTIRNSMARLKRIS